MRSSRASKHLNSGRARIRTLLLLSAFWGVSQVTPSTFSLFVDQAQSENTFTAAFIFPKNAQSLADQAGSSAKQANQDYEAIQAILSQCKHRDKEKAVSKEESPSGSSNSLGSTGSGVKKLDDTDVQTANSLAGDAQAAANNAQSISSDLSAKLTQAQNNINTASSKLNRQAAQRVYDYIQAARNQAETSASNADATAALAANAARQVDDCVKDHKKREEEEKTVTEDVYKQGGGKQ